VLVRSSWTCTRRRRQGAHGQKKDVERNSKISILVDESVVVFSTDHYQPHPINVPNAHLSPETHHER
jgi:hypothetical protein